MSNGHLHRVDQLGELLLRREELDLQPLADLHLRDRFFAAEEDVRAVRPLAGLVGPGVDERRRVGIGDLQIRLRRWASSACARARQIALVAIGGHHVEHGDLALEHLVVGREHVLLAELHPRRVDVARVGADEGQERAVAERRERSRSCDSG